MPDPLIKYRVNIEHEQDPIKLYKHLRLTIFARKFHNQRVKSDNKDKYSSGLIPLGFRLNSIHKFILRAHYKASVSKLSNKAWVLVYYFTAILNRNLFSVAVDDYIFHKIQKNLNN